MDPNKYPSGEKSSMGQVAPPPSYDIASPGYPPAGPGYPPQGQVGGPPHIVGSPYGQQPYPQQGPIMGQPTIYVAPGPLSTPANDYLCYSIFTLICCCMPLGIAALIYSIQTRDANQTGDLQAAQRNSRTARTLNHVALGIGLGSLILVIIYVAVVAAYASSGLH
ncbi:unnamed protein product [Tetraodon nigroviridis]|uniref:(spotted green pufferfish) hypothetical protein n=1 Tax=Tetraodon nigroviridis TaxID=99883 RepID=Q4RFG3_TETNG|nr:unnamed protein product [Tetraodon nigroviridis]